MKISQPVLEALDRATVTGNQLVLAGTLDRKLYVDTNKILEAIGGKWNRGAKAHVFDGPVSAVLDPIMETGEYSRTKQDFGQFDTPQDVVDRIIELLDPDSQGLAGKRALEPSAGLGNIANAVEEAGASVWAYEIDAKRFLKLCDRFEEDGRVPGGFENCDFLLVSPDDTPPFDLVAMNPPFAGQADIIHVLHAAKFLRPGGKLVSVMSAGAIFRENKRATDFREFVAARGGAFERLPDGAFSESGTGVHSCIVSFTV